eukprot:TRINITY_DN2923_c1_g1_i1.p1 TRINITY_DN2923_c1_g1~~TRINITY_DN2923_c1_g1_i1.p1  ORF type:complete len:424 (+),score=43.84 TRINITY_DN2923_c1_g1_i1:121-1392(+)
MNDSSKDPSYSESKDYSCPLLKAPNWLDSTPPSPGYSHNLPENFSYSAIEPEFPLLSPLENDPLSSDISIKNDYFEKADSSSTSIVTEKMKELALGKSKSKAHRKAKQKLPQSEEEKHAKRAEDNRRAAKESRERKKMYVESLEYEVKQLRAQVEYYKARLANYELIEKQRNLFGYEVYATLANTSKEIHEENKELTDPKAFTDTLAKTFDKFIEERRKALEQLARTMVEIVTPLPWRFFFWASENNLDLLDHCKLVQATNSLIPTESAKLLVETFKNSFGDKKKYNETKVFFTSSGVRIRSLVRQLVECQRNIQLELKRVGKHIYDNYMPNATLRLGQSLAPFAAILKNRPELNDYAMYQLKDTDFGVETYYGDEKAGAKMLKKSKSKRVKRDQLLCVLYVNFILIFNNYPDSQINNNLVDV